MSKTSLREAEAQMALERVRAWTVDAGLTLHPIKTRIVDADQERFDFLGFHFERGKRWPRDKSLGKFKDAIRATTPRLHGQSLRVVIANVNRTTRGWFEYFKHSSNVSVFRGLDGLIRHRLRRIPLERHRKHDYNGRGPAHQPLRRRTIWRELSSPFEHDRGSRPDGWGIRLTRDGSWGMIKVIIGATVAIRSGRNAPRSVRRSAKFIGSYHTGSLALLF